MIKKIFLNFISHGWVLIIWLASSTAAVAQSSACAANETVQTYTFASPNNWPAGAGGINYTVGSLASSVGISAVASLTNISPGEPVTSISGGFPDAFHYLVNRNNNTETNTATFTFSKPISKLQMVVTDIDTGGGGVNFYQDRATVVGAGPSGVVTPTAVGSSALVNIVGNVATSAGTVAQNCADTANLCNAIYTFPQPITSFALTYGNGPVATGDLPSQSIGLANLSFCVQNPDLRLIKDDADAIFVAGSSGIYTFTVNNIGSTATSGTATVKDVLPAGMFFTAPLIAGGVNGSAFTCTVSTTTNTNDTATCTTTTFIAAGGLSVFTLPVTVASTVANGTTLNNRAKVFGGGDPNKSTETSSGLISSCVSDSLSGSSINAGCGFESTPITTAANVVISKTDGKTVATSGDSNNYIVSLTNQGPSSADGVILTDVVGSGLTCAGASAVLCAGAINGAVCPSGILTIANLTGAGITVPTLPVNGSLQFFYACSVT